MINQLCTMSLARVAGDAGKTAGMTTILNYVANYYGVDWSAE